MFCIQYFFIAMAALLLYGPFLFGLPANDFPVSYQGRIRPFEAYSRLWLYDFYHREKVQNSHLSSFNTPDASPGTLLWRMHFLGHEPLNDAPLFFVPDARLKSFFSLNLKQDRFSYNELELENGLPQPLMKELVLYYYFKNFKESGNLSKGSKIELMELSPGLWGYLKGGDLVITGKGDFYPWNALNQDTVIASNISNPELYLAKSNRALAENTLQLLERSRHYLQASGKDLPGEIAFTKTYVDLRDKGLSPNEIAIRLDSLFPLSSRLREAGQDMKLLPGAMKTPDWYSPKAFKIKVFDPAENKMVHVSNFTVYSDATFYELRNLYLQVEKAMHKEDPSAGVLLQQFSESLMKAYREIEGKPYSIAHGKELRYPTIWQLKTEALYYRWPLIEIAIVLYALTAISLFLARGRLTKLSLVFLTAAFLIHTLVLGMRCCILGRPPVSNMFETVIYVPWISVLASLVLAAFLRNSIPIAASSLVSLGLLILLRLTNLNSSLENVQAVLDSQFWLIIHVLMVVGSYGLFALSAIAGHCYLFLAIKRNEETEEMKTVARLILQAMYLGISLLIPGTILGGVWAAESWGRFWDWDPKESWAFISSCVYLMWIHAYRFHHIGNFGLAVGSIVGLQAISFTWYGVNYILGTGLHSYGFGSGGEFYYYAFLLGETLFLGTALKVKRSKDVHVLKF